MRYFLVAFAIILNLAGCQPATESTLQNVVFIIGDDHATGVLGAYGNEIIRTPNLDKLASEGVLFNRAYTNSPMCSASRQSILTGKYPHAAGVTLLRTSFPQEQYTIAEHLKKYDFSTAIIGKNHFNNSYPHGFDQVITRGDWSEMMKTKAAKEIADSIRVRPQWKPFRDHARIWLNSDNLSGPYYDADSYSHFFTQEAISFIEQNQNNRFCLWLGYNEPHSPFNYPIEFSGRYDPADMPLPLASEEDKEWVPEVFSDLTDDEKKGIIAAYYTSVEYLDHNVGLVLDHLTELGLDKKTMVVYIGDHGYLLNHHGRFEKHMMWEEAVRSPLIIQLGEDSPTGKSEALTDYVDLVPTILDALGIEQMPDLHGESLMPLLSGEEAKHKELVFSEYLTDNKAMVRSRDWKYIYTSGKRDLGQGYSTGNGPTGPRHRLYDLKEDPGETTDVSDQPEYAAIMQELQQEMLRIFRETHPHIDQLPSDLSPEEQLAWFCEPPDEGAEPDAM